MSRKPRAPGGVRYLAIPSISLLLGPFFAKWISGHPGGWVLQIVRIRTSLSRWSSRTWSGSYSSSYSLALFFFLILAFARHADVFAEVVLSRSPATPWVESDLTKYFIHPSTIRRRRPFPLLVCAAFRSLDWNADRAPCFNVLFETSVPHTTGNQCQRFSTPAATVPILGGGWDSDSGWFLSSLSFASCSRVPLTATEATTPFPLHAAHVRNAHTHAHTHTLAMQNRSLVCC